MDSNDTCLSAISLDSGLKKEENYYMQVLLKECKYIEKKVVRHINDNLSDISSFDEPESDEESIRAMRLIFYRKIILKMSFLRD